MNIKLLLGAVSVIALTGCASSGPYDPPASLARKAVNTQAAISDYEATPATALDGSTRLDRKVDDLSRQVSELRAHMIMVHMAQEDAAKGLAGNADIRPLASIEATHRRSGAAASTTSTQHAQGVSFTLRHEPGKSAMDIDPEMGAQLLVAAKYSDHIVIRGRTSSEHFSEKSKNLAIVRAVRVKAFLIKNGVNPSKIKITYRSYGGFAADNSTSEGKAQNRRTQIDMVGLDPQVSAASFSEVTS